MDAEKLHTSWNSVCDKIKGYDNIDVSQINAFFSRLHPQAMSDGFLMLSADNEFIKTWIESHYIDFIKQALLDLYETPYTVIVEIDTSQSQQNATDIPKIMQAPAKTAETTRKEEHILAQPSKPRVKSVSEILAEMPEVPDRDVPPTEDIQSPTSSLTFENFVIGDSNRYAYSMAVSVAEMPGKTQLNPLFIYGKSGLGKTHLLRAIQNYVLENMPHMRTIYVDSAELLSDYMEAGAAHDKEKSSYKNFKNRYEEADLLLIDDVQYLQGKKQTLDIVFQIFNKLTSQGKQVILSADRAPKNIDIDERYKSRFNSGGISDIQPPEIETKLGIIKSFIEDYRKNETNGDFSIPNDIQIYIAEISSSNIRELKSAVTKIIYQMTFFNQPNISLDEVRKLLDNHFSGGISKRLSISDIQKEVEAFYKISHAELVGKKRSQNITYARQIALYLCRQMLEIPFNDIGKAFGRDHSTVMYSVNNVEKKIKENREVREELEALMQIIKEI